MSYFVSISFLLLTLISCAGDKGSTGSHNTPTDRNPTALSVETGDLQSSIYFNNEKRDVAKIRDVLGKVKAIPDRSSRIMAVTQEFLGTPYVGATLNIPGKEQLYVNTSGVDCATFVETVIALTLGAETENPDVEEYLKILQSLRYRDGVVSGFPSRLHYTSEWAADNIKRGNFREISGDFEFSQQRVKTIDFMTKHRDLYPPMKDEKVFKAIQDNEKALKDLHFAFIPTNQVKKAAGSFLKRGDVVAIVTDKPGLDVSHVGFIDIHKGVPYLVHASSKYKKVINDTVPLSEYLKRQKSPGIRVFRL